MTGDVRRAADLGALLVYVEVEHTDIAEETVADPEEVDLLVLVAGANEAGCAVALDLAEDALQESHLSLHVLQSERLRCLADRAGYRLHGIVLARA